MSPQLLLIIGRGILAAFCYWDAKKQGLSESYAYGLTLLTFFFPVFGIPIYFIVRSQAKAIKSNIPKLPTRLCPKCGHDNPGNLTQCEKCQNQLTL